MVRTAPPRPLRIPDKVIVDSMPSRTTAGNDLLGGSEPRAAPGVRLLRSRFGVKPCGSSMCSRSAGKSDHVALEKLFTLSRNTQANGREVQCTPSAVGVRLRVPLPCRQLTRRNFRRFRGEFNSDLGQTQYSRRRRALSAPRLRPRRWAPSAPRSTTCGGIPWPQTGKT